jgi:hypothetical protein
VVSLKRGTILVRRVQMNKSSKIEAVEFAKQARLEIGDRLGE